MEREIVFWIEKTSDGGYRAHALGHSIFTEAKYFEELKTMVQDAVRCHFASTDKPQLIRLHLAEDEIVAG